MELVSIERQEQYVGENMIKAWEEYIVTVTDGKHDYIVKLFYTTHSTIYKNMAGLYDEATHLMDWSIAPRTLNGIVIKAMDIAEVRANKE